MSYKVHIPGRPRSQESKQLVELVSKLHHPNVLRFGVTTTKEGNWALLVVVRPGTKLPIKAIEKQAHKYYIIYLVDNGKLQEARPAFPSFGE